MTELLLLLSLWTSHHKKPAPGVIHMGHCNLCQDAVEGDGFYEYLNRSAEENGCSIGSSEQAGMFYFYTGDDKMTGISGASCEGAKDDWRKLHIEPVRMSRA